MKHYHLTEEDVKNLFTGVFATGHSEPQLMVQISHFNKTIESFEVSVDEEAIEDLIEVYATVNQENWCGTNQALKENIAFMRGKAIGKVESFTVAIFEKYQRLLKAVDGVIAHREEMGAPMMQENWRELVEARSKLK